MRFANVATVFMIGVLSCSLQSAIAKDRCGSFEPVNFTPTKIDFKMHDGSEIKDYSIMRATVGDYRLEAGDTPAVIFNEKLGKSCEVQVEGVSGEGNDVYWLKKSNRFLYRSSSGSEQWVSLVDPKTCKILWKSRHNIGNNIKASSVEILPDCGACEEAGNFEGICDCQAAEVWRISLDCDLVKDKASSKKLTESALNVSFTGKKRVKGAKSAGAALAP